MRLSGDNRALGVIKEASLGPVTDGPPPIDLAKDPTVEGRFMQVYYENNPQFGAVRTSGLYVDPSDGSIQIGVNADETNERMREARVTSVYSNSPTQVACVDRIDSILGGIARLPTGETLLAYAWGLGDKYSTRPADSIQLARGTPGACSAP